MLCETPTFSKDVRYLLLDKQQRRRGMRPSAVATSPKRKSKKPAESSVRVLMAATTDSHKQLKPEKTGKSKASVHFCCRAQPSNTLWLLAARRTARLPRCCARQRGASAITLLSLTGWPLAFAMAKHLIQYFAKPKAVLRWSAIGRSRTSVFVSGVAAALSTLNYLRA
jgi:hypothetical protein